MAKPLVVGIAAAVVVVAAGVVFVMLNQPKAVTNEPTDTMTASKLAKTKKVAPVDPDGAYKLFSDQSITKHPEDGAKFGDHQTLEFEYDGSKTNNDPYARLSYNLYYIQDDGKVEPIGSGKLDGLGTGKGPFTVADSILDPVVSDRQGFFELIGTDRSGEQVKLGMYSISFDASE